MNEIFKEDIDCHVLVLSEVWTTVECHCGREFEKVFITVSEILPGEF